ncbi:metallophosphoesterase family protein [Rhodobacter ferrooxidans]|uniref:Metallophosphoesterase n=1 Tax=Rhodobacter ferrooxidans TaxID=371731 RepID=C8S5F0_9RHOB|nr:metallophosphoesterase family protein [Rhodobacter sp. SW2]EEW23763.1 metallophosphoesterase [Rhodobacter sp. SW2]
MRIAILTDIHGNREALTAVLADLADRHIDQIAILGDIVGYGPDPDWCTDAVMAMVQAGAFCVMGNHDSAIGNTNEMMNADARRVIDWSRDRLSDGQKAFLAGLPMTEVLDDLMFVHASANHPTDWIYVTSAHKAMPSFRVCGSRAIFCGHVHVPALICCDGGGRVTEQRFVMGMPMPLIRSRRWLAVVGSVGQPRDHNPRASYAVYDMGKNELTFRRVGYDNAATAEKLRKAGLPESLAARLMRGE